MATIVFKCPQCGGPFEFTEGNRVSVCTFCGMTSAIAGDAGINRLLIPERLDVHAARSAVRKILAAGGGDTNATSFSVVSSELLFLPFWRIKGMAIGWQWQQNEVIKEEIDYDENGTRYTKKVRQPDEQKFSPIAKPLDVTIPAGDYRFFGSIRSGIAASVLKSEIMNPGVVSSRGNIVTPLKGLARARLETIALQHSGSKNNTMVRDEWRIRIADEWNSLLYYPVWFFLFSRGENMYPVTVDAVGGEVTRCRFPGTAHRSPFLPLALLALIVWGWTTSPIVGAVSTAVSWWMFVRRYGAADPYTIMNCLLDRPQREKGVERG